ncbi:hypothetical protein SMICM17S_12938 [Streptomyces microflavus]
MELLPSGEPQAARARSAKPLTGYGRGRAGKGEHAAWPVSDRYRSNSRCSMSVNRTSSRLPARWPPVWKYFEPHLDTRDQSRPDASSNSSTNRAMGESNIVDTCASRVFGMRNKAKDAAPTISQPKYS